MRQFFRGRRAQVRYLDIKMQSLARQRVVGIHIRAVPAGLDHRDRPHAFSGLHLHHLPRL